MSTAELKSILIKKIQKIEDPVLLEELVQRIKYDESEEFAKVTEAQLASIRKGIADVRNGKVLTEEEANSEIDKWLEEE